MKKYYPSIQVLRGVLFLFILAFHCGVPYANFGWGGVEAFFVISAFFLVRKYWGSQTLNVKDLFRHRIERLYPPYIAVLIVAALYALLKKAIPFDLATHLLATQNFQWMITDYQSAMQPMTAHTWTLSIEVWCGLFWLLLLKGLSKTHFKKTMYVFLLIGIVYRVTTIVCGADVWSVSLCPLAHLDAFACGSSLAIRVKEKRTDKRIGFLGLIGLAGIIVCVYLMSRANGISLVDAYRLLSLSKNYLNHWFTGNIYLFISLLTTGLVGLLYIHDENQLGEAGQIEKIFVKLGNNSYGLYLFHWPISVVLGRFVHHWGTLFVITFIGTILVNAAFNWIYRKYQKGLTGDN